MKEYGFKIGERHFILSAKSEKEALKLLIEKSWDFIDEYSIIELLGELTDKKKVLDLNE